MRNFRKKTIIFEELKKEDTSPPITSCLTPTNGVNPFFKRHILIQQK